LSGSLFLLLELSVRVYLFGWAGLVPARINSVHELPQADLTRRSSEPRLAIELKPNLDRYFKLARFRTNSQGLRDREYSLRKPAHTFRVAVLGSSFSLPAGVEIEAAFHSLLEAELSSGVEGQRYEFINFAVGMYGPKQILAQLELRALDYDPDLILVSATRLSAPLFGIPEAPVTLEKLRAIPVFERSYPILQSFLFRLIAQRTAREPGESHLYVGSLERLFMDFIAWWSPEAVDSMRRSGPSPSPGNVRVDRATDGKPGTRSILEGIAAISRRTGIPVVLVRLEIEPSDPPGEEEELAAASRALGIRYLDTRRAFRGTRPSDYWIYALDPHPNARAHEIFAREIASFLDSEQLLPATRGQ
jgi:hypothetical protein